ncbi:MAG: YraN family protein [Dissulfuribacterales bacterium]
MNKTGAASIGGMAEELAAEYLIKRRYDILERNYKTRWGEIDIIAMDGSTLVFVEVKARRGEGCGLPQEAVSRQKQYKIIRMAQQYMSQCDYRGKKDFVFERPVRFDVLAIQWQGGVPLIEHILHAFDTTDLPV